MWWLFYRRLYTAREAGRGVKRSGSRLNRDFYAVFFLREIL